MSLATMTLKPLTEAELNFINNQVNGAFLHKYGTAKGYGMFCKVANQQGFKCQGGPQAKASYATYLKNASTPGGTLLAQAVAGYNALDGFTKAAMAGGVKKGKDLKDKTLNVACFTKFTVQELKDIADAYKIKVSGSKANVCAQLQASGVDLTALWAGQGTLTIGAKQPGPAAWKAYASKTKKRGRVPRSYAQAADYEAASLPRVGAPLSAADVAYWDSLNGSQAASFGAE